MESNTFYDIYLEELKNLPQGTPEEETALLKKLTEGDKTAASRLTELKLAKAVQIAEEYHDRGLPAGDLVQEANMALFLFASEYENGDFDAQMEKKVRAAIEDALRFRTVRRRSRRRWRRVLMSSRIFLRAWRGSWDVRRPLRNWRSA